MIFCFSPVPYTPNCRRGKLNPGSSRLARWLPWPGIMELLTCPACGCSVQVADVLLGQSVRCFACRHSFVAEARPAAPPSPRRDAPPLPRPARPPRNEDEDVLPDEGGPFCPGCGQRISWNDLECPYCGEEFEPEKEPR